MKRRAVLAAALILTSASAHANIDPDSFKSFAFRQHPGAKLPLDARLIDESGRPTTLGQAMGQRPSLLVLEYLHCANLCSLVLSGAVKSMHDAHLVPGRDVDLVAVSIDPRDTSAQAAAARDRYSQAFQPPNQAAVGLRFLTGPADQVKRIASVVGFPYRYDPKSQQFLHPAGYVVVTPDGRIARYMLGIAQPAPALRDAVDSAEEGREATSPVQSLLLLCFGYHAEPGSVAAKVMSIVRWVAGGLILACALLIFFLSRRRRAA